MYVFQTTLLVSLEEAIPRVLDCLKQEGFGVLMDLDIQSTMKQKIGAEMEPYHILGACNPALAHKALVAEPDIGALLPCNVVVRSKGKNQTIVSFMDPQAMKKLTNNHEVHAVAQEAEVRLRRVYEALDKNL